MAWRAALVGIGMSTVLNLVVMFVPMPDILTEAVVALQIVGLWIEIRRATPYHMSSWNPFLINAAVYAVITLAIMLVRSRRHARIATPAV